MLIWVKGVKAVEADAVTVNLYVHQYCKTREDHCFLEGVVVPEMLQKYPMNSLPEMPIWVKAVEAEAVTVNLYVHQYCKTSEDHFFLEGVVVQYPHNCGLV
jgi:hypothetical protein